MSSIDLACFGGQGSQTVENQAFGLGNGIHARSVQMDAKNPTLLPVLQEGTQFWASGKRLATEVGRRLGPVGIPTIGETLIRC